jgi:hypothetical protein
MRKLITPATGCCLVAFLIGIIVGIAIDVKERKNTVRMAIQYDSAEVYVAPFVGDTVKWFQVMKDGTFTPVKADFGGGDDPSMSPCDPAYEWDKPNCHIREPGNYRDRYRYHCAPYPCIDPGGGPQSSTGLDYMSVKGPRFWSVLFFDFKSLFHLQQQSPVAPAGGAKPKAIVGSPIHMQVGCPSSTKKLTVYDQNGNETNSINAMPNNQIVWDTALNPLTIADNSSLCSGNINDLANTGCIINADAKGSHTYIASSTDAKCSNGNRSTQTVVLP